jgi:putative hydrolase of the HAD superfamily
MSVGDARFRAVLFDFFGTLTRAVQRGPRHARIARSLGCCPNEFFALLDRTFLIRSRGWLGPPEETLRWLCTELGAHPTDAALRTACRDRVTAIRADVVLRDDAVPALRAVRRRGLRTAVVSDCGPELPEFLPELPSAPLLDASVFSVQIGQCKPHPAMFLTACTKLDVAPGECLYVGDGGGRELDGATRVGMTAVRLTAADLATHLTFDPQPDWPGRSADSLTAALDYLDRPVAPERAPALV